MGPGIITGFAGNDAGGVTTYTAVGAHYGFAMLWLLLLSTAGLLVIQEMCARMGAVTGKGLSDLIRERFGVRWTIVAMVALLVANGSNVVAEFAGVAASLELLAVIAYPVSAIIVKPDWEAVGKGFVIPTLPTEQAALIAALALVGTTITPYMMFYIQASIVDKGIGRDLYRFARIDVSLGAILTGLNGFFIIIVAGAVLFPHHVIVNSAADAAQALGPLAGAQAKLLFGIGLFGASMLAATVMPLSTSYAICEAFGWEAGISKDFREAPVFMGLFTLLLVIGALVVLSPSVPLIPLILVSQNVNGLLLPIVLVFILKLAGDRSLMGDQANGRVSQVIGVGTALGASALSIALVAITILGATP